MATRTSAPWKSEACGEAPTIPLLPSSVGNGDDLVAQAFYGDNVIGSSSGSFTSVTGLTRETDSIYGANAYTLQDDSNFFTTTTSYTGVPALGWEQFIFLNYPLDGVGYAYIQYWLINFASTYGGCPSNSPPGGTQGFLYSGSCYANGPAAVTPLEAPSNLGNLMLSGYADYNSDDESYLCISGGSCYGVGLTGQVLDLYHYWRDSEFNVFGAGGGSQAEFNVGTSITLANSLNIQTSCATAGFTGETNNLNLGSCSAGSYQIVFPESDNSLATPNISTSLVPPRLYRREVACTTPRR